MNFIHIKRCFDTFLFIAFSEEKLVIAFLKTAPTCAAQKETFDGAFQHCLPFSKEKFLDNASFLVFPTQKVLIPSLHFNSTDQLYSSSIGSIISSNN
jgi:hypothetical protein